MNQVYHEDMDATKHDTFRLNGIEFSGTSSTIQY